MKYCAKCILNGSTPFIDFDNKGICNYCDEQRIMQTDSMFGLFLDKEELEASLKKIRGKNKYDCIVLVSGGKDSISALYMVKEVLKLNPLAITFSNGFLIAGMVENVQDAVKILGIDWRLYHFSNIKKGFEYFLKSPYRRQISVCDVCSLFISPISIAQNIAKEEEIKIIFTGSTIEQRIGSLPTERMPKAHKKYYETYDQIKEKVAKYLSRFEDIKEILSKKEDQDTSFVTSPWYYFDQNLGDLKKILSELKWKSTPESFPGYSSNCRLSYLSGYLGRKYSISNYDISLSRSIRLNKISRAEAMERFLRKILTSDINSLLNEIDLDVDNI